MVFGPIALLCFVLGARAMRRALQQPKHEVGHQDSTASGHVATSSGL